MDGIAQVEMLDDGSGVGGVVVHVVTIADLARAAMAAPVMGDDAIALSQEVEHLGVPVVGAQRPAMVEDDGLGVLRVPVLVEDFGAVPSRDRVHGLISSVALGWSRRGGDCHRLSMARQLCRC